VRIQDRSTQWKTSMKLFAAGRQRTRAGRLYLQARDGSKRAYGAAAGASPVRLLQQCRRTAMPVAAPYRRSGLAFCRRAKGCTEAEDCDMPGVRTRKDERDAERRPATQRL